MEHAGDIDQASDAGLALVELLRTCIDDVRLELADRDEELRCALLEVARLAGCLASAADEAARPQPPLPDTHLAEAVASATAVARSAVDGVADLTRLAQQLMVTVVHTAAQVDHVALRLQAVELQLDRVVRVTEGITRQITESWGPAPAPVEARPALVPPPAEVA